MTKEEEDLYYSPSNMRAVDEGFEQLERGEGVSFTVDELRAVAKFFDAMAEAKDMAKAKKEMVLA